MAVPCSEKWIRKGALRVLSVALLSAALAAGRLAAGPPGPDAIRFEHLTDREGLSQVTVSAIVQDRKGFMWIGTVGGLVAGRGSLTLEEVPLVEVASEAVGLLAGPIAERGAEVEIAPDLPAVQGDRTQLLQLFQNLLANAVAYMGEQEEPRIEVGTRTEGGDSVVYVRDNGMGIAREDQDKIFGLFERLAKAGEGTGLGLALVQLRCR